MSGIFTREAKERQYERNLNILNIDEQVMMSRSAVLGHKLTVAVELAFLQNQEHANSFIKCISKFYFSVPGLTQFQA